MALVYIHTYIYIHVSIVSFQAKHVQPMLIVSFLFSQVFNFFLVITEHPYHLVFTARRKGRIS